MTSSSSKDIPRPRASAFGNPQDEDPEGGSVIAMSEDMSDAENEQLPLLRKKSLTSRGVQAYPETEDTFFSDLKAHFGFELLAVLFVAQHLVKGFAMSFIQPCIQYLFASYNVSGPQVQIYSGVMLLPWAMKPVIGLLSDALPIRGYNKGPYMIITSVLAIAGLLVIGSTPQAQLSVTTIVACLFFVQLQFSTVDLLTEAKYAEKIQSKPEKGPALMTYVWSGLTAAGLVAILMIGPIMERFGVKVPFLIAILPTSSIIIPVARGYLEERQLSYEDIATFRRYLFAQKEACLLCCLMLVGTLMLTVVGMTFQSVYVNTFTSITVCIVMLIAFSVFLRPEIAKVNAFFLIQSSLNLSISGASFYFYTNTKEQYPEGPHFSMWFYTTALGTCGALCSLVGLWSYHKFASDWSYRYLLLVSNIAVSVLSLLDVVLFTRLNRRMGIPDENFVLGGTVLYSMVSQWLYMPGVVIMSQLCPRGMEAIMYSLLAGCHNLGTAVASNCGALLLDVLNVKPTGAVQESKQFENLWIGSAVSTALPAITLILLPFLIPDRRQTDKLITEGENDATTNSLWKRWNQEAPTETPVEPYSHAAQEVQ